MQNESAGDGGTAGVAFFSHLNRHGPNSLLGNQSLYDCFGSVLVFNSLQFFDC